MNALGDDSELGRAVAVGEIERELQRLWAADAARTKASLMNVVVYSEVAGSLGANSVLMGELTREHACRAILVELNRAVPEVTTRAWLTAHCHLAGGRKAVCCEQIAFALTGRSVGRLRNVVFAHLASDLPLVFWWQGELTARFTERLTSVIDRLVFDSAEWRDAADGFARMVEAREETAGRLVLHDLEWSRSWQFRLAVASLFDDPRAWAALAAAERVRVVHHPRHRCAALQLLAWFVLRAGWRAARELPLDLPVTTGPVDSRAFDRADGGPVQVVVEADPAAAALGRFEILGAGIQLVVERVAGEARVVRRRRDSGADCESSLPADPEAAVDLVGGQLARGGRNSLFQDVMPSFLNLLGGGAADRSSG